MNSKDTKEAIIGIALTIALTFLFGWGIYQAQLTERVKAQYSAQKQIE